jgi:hypothetical protein
MTMIAANLRKEEKRIHLFIRSYIFREGLIGTVVFSLLFVGIPFYILLMQVILGDHGKWINELYIVTAISICTIEGFCLYGSYFIDFLIGTSDFQGRRISQWSFLLRHIVLILRGAAAIIYCFAWVFKHRWQEDVYIAITVVAMLLISLIISVLAALRKLKRIK